MNKKHPFSKQKLKQILTKTAIVGGGLLIGGVGEKIYEDLDNHHIVTELKDKLNDADSISYDAKTTHFYAHKNLSEEEILQQKDYLLKLQRERTKVLKEKRKSDIDTQSAELDEAVRKGDLAGIDMLLHLGAKANILTMYLLTEKDSYVENGNSFEVMQRVLNSVVDYSNNNSFHRRYTPDESQWETICYFIKNRIDGGDKKWQTFYDVALQQKEYAKEKGYSEIDSAMVELQQKKEEREKEKLINYDQEFMQYLYEKDPKTAELEYYLIYERTVPTDFKLTVVNEKIKEVEEKIKTGKDYQINTNSRRDLKIAAKMVQKGQDNNSL